MGIYALSPGQFRPYDWRSSHAKLILGLGEFRVIPSRNTLSLGYCVFVHENPLFVPYSIDLFMAGPSFRYYCINAGSTLTDSLRSPLLAKMYLRLLS